MQIDLNKVYFTGIACKNGHISDRFISNRWCVECSRISNKKNNKKISQRRLAIKQSSSRNIAKNLRLLKYKGNPCRVCKNSIRYTKDGRCQKCSSNHYKDWRLKNLRYKAYKQALRRAIQLSATPKWSELLEIKQFYLNCPDGFQVDHKIPLQNEIVCGLHVLQNLQYLTAENNLIKGNKFNECHQINENRLY